MKKEIIGWVSENIPIKSMFRCSDIFHNTYDVSYLIFKTKKDYKLYDDKYCIEHFSPKKIRITIEEL